MQQIKTKIKPPYVLDGIQPIRKGKVINYKVEKDTHIEQYLDKMQMRQQMMKFKQDRISQRNISQKQSKSFEYTIHQQKQTQVLNQPSSPQHQTNSIVANTQKVSRSLSKEHFITILESLITTVQNVQQLVNSYFPQDQIDDQISKQQNELTKISEATQQLTKKLGINSLGNKKEVENIKTQKNFSQLPNPTYKSKDANGNHSKRRKDQLQKLNISAIKYKVNQSKTIERNQNIELEEPNNHNFTYQNYQSVQDNTIIKTIIDKPLDQIKNQRNIFSYQQKLLQIKSDQTTQLQSVRSSQQKQIYQYKKHNKEVQLVQTKQRQCKNGNSIQFISQSPKELKSKSVGTQNNQQKNQCNNYSKLDFKKINSINVEKSKMNINTQVSSLKKSTIPSKTNINLQSNKNQINNEFLDLGQIQSNYSVQQSKIQNQVNQVQIQEEEKVYLNETEFFNNIIVQEEKKEKIGKMIESNEIQRFNVDEEDKQQEFNQNQVIENDQKCLEQQLSYNYKSLGYEENGSEIQIKVVESIDAQSNQDIVNPLEDSDDDQYRDNKESFLITTLEQSKNQQLI